MPGGGGIARLKRDLGNGVVRSLLLTGCSMNASKALALGLISQLAAAAIVLAISAGGNLFPAVVIDPVWSGSPPESVRTFATGPFVARVRLFRVNPFLPVGMVCLLASPFLTWPMPAMRRWLLVAAASYLVVLLATFLYFWPINNKPGLMSAGGTVDSATVISLTRQWILADRFRYVLRVAAFVCVLRAMVLSARGQ